jgi:16S rRNA (uracil1498-N3)-methyltransferase
VTFDPSVASDHWFFAPPEAWATDALTLPPDESHHATRVLRISPPDVITVTDGRGTVARCAVAGTSNGELRAEILERERRTPPTPRLVVYQGAAKGGKLDDVIERLAELGVAEFWSFEAERSVVVWDESKLARLNQRWASIARSAAKQSRSPFLLEAHAGLAWDRLLVQLAQEPLAVALWEGASLPLRAVLEGRVERVALVVGPEGGLSRAEAESLADAGAPLVSLGPNILRTENAAVVAASALLFHYGLIG